MTGASMFFFALAMACMVGVVVVFLLGMTAMARGRSEDHKTSNKMMSLRVMFQAGAIFFLFLAFATK